MLTKLTFELSFHLIICLLLRTKLLFENLDFFDMFSIVLVSLRDLTKFI